MAANYLATNSADIYGTGLSDVVKNAYGLNPAAIDSDCEGLPDAWKIAHGLNPSDPTVANPANIELYVEGGPAGATNVQTVVQTNLFNVFFSGKTNNGTPITGAALAGSGSGDTWNFCSTQPEYTANGVSLLNAAGQSSDAKLFAFIGPCSSIQVVPPTPDDWQQNSDGQYALTYGNYSNSVTTTTTITNTLFQYYVCFTFNRFYNPWYGNMGGYGPWNGGLPYFWNAYYTRFGFSSYGGFLPYPGNNVWGNFDWFYDNICSYLPGNVILIQPPDAVRAELEASSSWPSRPYNYGGPNNGWGWFGGGLFIGERVVSEVSNIMTQSSSYMANLSTYITSNPTLATNIPPIMPPTTMANFFLSPFTSIDANGYSLAGNYGATWNDTGNASNTNLQTFASGGQLYANFSGGWLKSTYPDAQRTLFITGLTPGNYDVYVYYSCPSNVAPAMINGTPSTPFVNGANARYWYKNVDPISIPAQADMYAAMTSSVPAELPLSQPNQSIRIDVDWPNVSDPSQDVKISGLQLVCRTRTVYTSAALQAGAGNDSVYLVWHDAATTASFNIYRSIYPLTSTNPIPWPFVATTSQRQYQDTNLTAGVTYYYYVVGATGGTSEPASGVASAVPFGCVSPLPPRIDYVNPLKTASDNGIYSITLQMLLNNSDAVDPQGNPLVFKVASVTSGSLMIDGMPFSPANNTIGNTNSVVWIPPAVMLAPGIPAFRVYVFDGVNRSANTVNVSIKQSPQTHLYGWGVNQYGSVGNGYLWPNNRQVVGETFYDVLKLQDQLGFIPRDPRWKYYPRNMRGGVVGDGTLLPGGDTLPFSAYWNRIYERFPQRVLDLDSASYTFAAARTSGRTVRQLLSWAAMATYGCVGTRAVHV